MMTRTQISIDSELQRRARERASELGVSFAEYIRELVARDVAGFEPRVDPSAVFDLGSSSGSDVARHKDRMLAEAVGARETFAGDS